MGFNSVFNGLRYKILWKRRVYYLLPYSVQQSPSWEANRFPAIQEIPRILWRPKIHYRIQKCPPPVPILSQLDAVHTPTFHFLMIHFNIILPSTPGSPQWSLSLRFPYQDPVQASPFPNTRHMPRPCHSPSFYHCDVNILQSNHQSVEYVLINLASILLHCLAVVCLCCLFCNI